MPKNAFAVSVTNLPENDQPQIKNFASEKPPNNSRKPLCPSKEVAKTGTFRTIFKASKFSLREISRQRTLL